MARTAIEFRRVSKQYPGTAQYAVNEVSAAIPEGEFVTILGTSGSGKTTLLKMINRIYESTAGEILFFGENIKGLKVEAYRRQIGYVIQQIGLFPHMTVAENIAVVPRILHWDTRRIARRVDELLNLVGLVPQEYKTRYPRQLSGGQQQRVGLARAMAADPAVMLMDEPFGALDPITRQNLQDELLRIQKTLNKTILFVTHDVGEAVKLGDRVMILHNGQLQQFDTPGRILLQPANGYVSRLVSAEDRLQQLKAVTAESAMTAVQGPYHQHTGRIGREASLYAAVTCLLENPHPYVLVEDEAGTVVGKLTWNEVKVRQQRQPTATA